MIELFDKRLWQHQVYISPLKVLNSLHKVRYYHRADLQDVHRILVCADIYPWTTREYRGASYYEGVPRLRKWVREQKLILGSRMGGGVIIDDNA